MRGNETLAPFGPSRVLRVKGRLPQFEVLDEYTVRYAWDEPNPFFLPALARARPEPILAPAHYLRRFHARYSDEAELEAIAEEEGRRNWGAVHINRFRPYKNTNPELPTLQPWINTTRAPSQRYVFERNPFYHRVDEEGRQLPYIDRVIVNIADAKLIPAKAGAGETDLQARHLAFGDYPFLKQAEERSGYRVRLWDTTKGAHVALLPNLNVQDPVWRGLVRDARFRRALSLAIDREEINYVIYYGLALGGNDSILPGSPLYRPQYRNRWAGYDLSAAAALLDDMGLDRRDSDGTRLLPDGRRMEIIVETAGEDSEQTDVLELVETTWAEIDIKMYTKPLQREVLRNRIFSGRTLMSVWSGLENGVPSADMSPQEARPDQPDPAPVAQVGPVRRVRRRGRRAGGSAARAAPGRAERGVGGGACARAPRSDLARDARNPRGPGIHARHRGRGAATGRREPAPAQRAGARCLQLDARRLLRRLPSGHLLVRRRAVSTRSR